MKIYKKQCSNCLFSNNPIVSVKRKANLLKGIIKNQQYFICHKATQKQEDIMCKGFYDNFGKHSQTLRIAQRLKVVEMVDHG